MNSETDPQILSVTQVDEPRHCCICCCQCASTDELVELREVQQVLPKRPHVCEAGLWGWQRKVATLSTVGIDPSAMTTILWALFYLWNAERIQPHGYECSQCVSAGVLGLVCRRHCPGQQLFQQHSMVALLLCITPLCYLHVANLITLHCVVYRCGRLLSAVSTPRHIIW